MSWTVLFKKIPKSLVKLLMSFYIPEEKNVLNMLFN
jgi:hypothetical protein